ncbi:MAG: NUDIX hydrolase [Actinomycetaceae bacterium]|nr:NUDIX hydrolase [Actinomycetaceae bacterium]
MQFEADNPRTAQITATTMPWQGRLFAVHADKIVLAEGEGELSRDYLVHPGAVAIVPLRQVEGQWQVALIYQYRHPVRANLWEIPAGLTDIEGEELLQTAKRELAEEIQMEAETWNVLVDTYASPGCSTEKIRVFLARNLRPTALPEGFVREGEEAEMHMEWVNLDKIQRAIFEGKLHNPSVITGVLATVCAVQSNFKDLRAA